MGQKKPNLSKYYKVLREERIINLHRKYGDVIKPLIYSEGHTANDLSKCGFEKIKIINNYIDYFNFRSKVDENTKTKLSNNARKYGKLSSITLKGVHLKPITDEIEIWYKDQLKSGEYKGKVMTELKNKFGYGRKKYHQLCELHGEPIRNPQSGILNPMYGKSPSKNAGNGIKCKVYHNGKSIFCRSLLELKIYLYLIDNSIKFELSNHRIKYEDNGIRKTYLPDIVFIDNDTVCEIKPSSLVSSKSNILKFSNAKKYCDEYNLNFSIITETTYDVSYINYDYIMQLVNIGTVTFDNNNLNRFKNAIKYYK